MKYRQATVCQACRSRKLGCDGKSPSCSQCVLKGRQCPGYHAQWVYIHSTAPSVSRKQVPRVLFPPQLSKPLSWPLRDIVSLCAQNFVPFDSLTTRTNVTLDVPRICGAWIEVLPSFLGDAACEAFLSPAIKAFAMSILARGAGGLAPASDAFEAQGKALRQLRIALSSKNQSLFDMQATAMMCLFLSEVLLPTTHSGPFIHADGIASFIQQRSPAYYASGFPHRLFVGFRPMLILHSFLKRKSSFVAHKSWLEEPFSTVSAIPLQQLMSDAAVLPEVFELLDKAQLEKPWPSVSQAILIKLLQALNNIEATYNSFIVSKPSLQGWPIPSGCAPIIFPDITTANFLTHYWTFWVICVTHILRLQAHDPDFSQALPLHKREAVENLTSPLASRQAMEFCCLILRSVDYLTQDCFGLYGAASLSLPFQTAFRFLANYEHMANGYGPQLAQQTLDMIASRGYSDILGTGLTEFQYPRTRWVDYTQSQLL